MDIVFGKDVKEGTWIGSISLDASLSEVHSMTGTATTHPVEAGSNISDNVHNDPRMVRIDGFITNHPIELPKSQVDGVRRVEKTRKYKADPDIPLVQVGGPGVIGAVTGAIGSALGLDEHEVKADGFSPDFDRVRDVMTELEAIYNAKRLIDIVTTLTVYRNMIIESLEVTRSPGAGNVLSFTATAKQIIVVETQLVAAPPEPLVERGKPKTDRGKKSKSEASLLDSSKGKSFAASLIDSAPGFL